VVFADEEYAGLLGAGKVQAFVEGAMIDGAVAEKGGGDALRAPRARAERGPDRMRDAAAHNAVGAKDAMLRVVEMHAAAPSAAAASGFGVELRHQRGG